MEFGPQTKQTMYTKRSANTMYSFLNKLYISYALEKLWVLFQSKIYFYAIDLTLCSLHLAN